MGIVFGDLHSFGDIVTGGIMVQSNACVCRGIRRKLYGSLTK